MTKEDIAAARISLKGTIYAALISLVSGLIGGVIGSVATVYMTPQAGLAELPDCHAGIPSQGSRQIGDAVA